MDDQKPIAVTDELLFRCLEGIAGDAEYEQAWRWIDESQQNKAHYSDMRDAWIAADLLKPVDIKRQRQIWSRLEKKMQPTQKRGKKIRMNYLKWAAAAAVVVFAYILGTQRAGQQEKVEIVQETNTYLIEAPKGENR